MTVAFLPVAVLGGLLIYYTIPNLGSSQSAKAFSLITAVLFALVLSMAGYLLSRREAVDRLRINALHADRQNYLFHMTVSLKDARDTAEVAEALVDGATQILMAERGSFSLLRDGRAKLVALKSHNAPLETPMSGEYVIDVDTGVIGDAVHTGASLRLLNPDKARVPMDEALNQQTRDIIVVPVFDGEQAVGAIEVSNPVHGGTFDDADVQMLEHIARAAGMTMGVVMSRERQAEQRERLLDMISEILDNTVVWEGHHSRVVELCTQIARRMGLSSEDTRDLTVAAKLHDIGLAAGGDERAHPVEGARMMATLGFSATVGRIIGTHHERIDGSGYPLGLTLNDLPQTSRILAVVEAFETGVNPASPQNGLTVDAFRVQAEQDAGLDPKVVRTLFEVLEFEGALKGAQAS